MDQMIKSTDTTVDRLINVTCRWGSSMTMVRRIGL
jgi:hypothetical protein